MSLSTIPNMPFAIDTTRWDQFQDHFDRLREQNFNETDLASWLREWSDLDRLVEEVGAIAYIGSSLDTSDEDKEKAFLNFVENMAPGFSMADQLLKERLLAIVMTDDQLGDDLRIPMQKMRNQADLFREENVPLFTELAKLGNEYDKTTGGMKAEWEGEEKNLNQLNSLLINEDRDVRERAWKTMLGLWLDKREELNTIYRQMLELRRKVADNAGFPDYRAFTFRSSNRFDYSPEDCLRFHEAIETVVVPAAERIYEDRRRKLGLERLQPWDLMVDPSGEPSLKPYRKQDELVQGSLNIFQHVDPSLARHFATMAEENLLDLDTRAGKALGGYCATLPWRKRPFIFMNGDGTHDDVQTMLHESGHAFHAFESSALPYIWQGDVPLEFCEVASMGMELISAPYLTKEYGGFYTPAEASRARIEHLSSIITFLPYMAVVDGFQHWVYTHPDLPMNSSECDKAWSALWKRFMRGVDWTGYEDECVTGWHRKLHIFQIPFYYIEYGLAQVGALQVWRNALQDQAEAVKTYRHALQLGGTRSLPELFAAAGAEFRFDEAMLTDLVSLIESTIAKLEQVG